MTAEAAVLRLRASKLPDGAVCAPSVLPDDLIEIDTGDDGPARLGSAFHEWARHVERPFDERPPLVALANRFRVDLDELEPLVRTGFAQWRDQLGEWFAGGETEVGLEHECDLDADLPDVIRLTGTADRLIRRVERPGGLATVRQARILDWKTGRKEVDHADQLRGYAFLAFMADPELDEVYVAIAHVRFRYLDGETITRDEALAWWADYRRHIRDNRTRYRVGDHCPHCPKWAACPARRALVATTVEHLPEPVEITRENVAELGPSLVEAYRALRGVEAEAKKRISAVRALLQEFEAIPDGNGRELVLGDTERRQVDRRRAMPVFGRFGLTADDIDDASTVSMSEVDDILHKRAPKGKGASRKRMLAEQLVDAGALTYTNTKSIRLVKTTAKSEVTE